MASSDFIVNKQLTWSVSDEIWEHWCDWRVGEKKKYSPNSYKLFLWQWSNQVRHSKGKHSTRIMCQVVLVGGLPFIQEITMFFFSCSMCKDIIKSIQPRISKIFHTQMSQKQRYSIHFQRRSKYFFHILQDVYPMGLAFLANRVCVGSYWSLKLQT